MKHLLILTSVFVSVTSFGQTNTFPSSGSVGIGTTSPGKALEVIGDISLPSWSGNKQIYTWAPNDFNWRIGMSVTPGFTTSMATGHVEYLSYANNPGQGFAVGVTGGQSSFEITGSDHNAFFRGNVGIGTTSPSSRLHVSGSGIINGLIETTDNSIASMLFKGNGKIWQWSKRNTSESDMFQLNFYNGTTWQPSFLSVLTSGNVGIGTTSPRGQLDVAGTGDIYLSNNTVAGTGQSLYLPGHLYVAPHAGTNWSYFQARRSDDSGSTNFRFRTFNSGAITEAMSILSNGNVGIGTTQPDFPLTVNGSIHAKEVRVDLIGALSVPDYVFEKDYKLASLEDIKTYIEQNKHLPEVPSAKEIEKSGVQLGEMNLILLKKIEEITLHLIKQEERAKQQEERIRTLETEIKLK